MNRVAVESMGNKSRVGIMSTRIDPVAAAIVIVLVIVDVVLKVARLLKPLLLPAPIGRLGVETFALDLFRPRFL